MTEQLIQDVQDAMEEMHRRGDDSATATGTYDGHDIRYEVKHIGTTGFIIGFPWYYEAVYVDGDLVYGHKTDFPPDHPPTTEGARSAVEFAVKHADGTPLYLPSPPKKTEDEVSPGLL